MASTSRRPATPNSEWLVVSGTAQGLACLPPIITWIVLLCTWHTDYTFDFIILIYGSPFFFVPITIMVLIVAELASAAPSHGIILMYEFWKTFLATGLWMYLLVLNVEAVFKAAGAIVIGICYYFPLVHALSLYWGGTEEEVIGRTGDVERGRSGRRVDSSREGSSGSLDTERARQGEDTEAAEDQGASERTPLLSSAPTWTQSNEGEGDGR